MLNRLPSGVRIALCFPGAYFVAKVLPAPIGLLLGYTAVTGAVSGAIFAACLVAGVAVAPSPRWRPAVFYALFALFISWALLPGDAGDFWTAFSRTSLGITAGGGIVVTALDRKHLRTPVPTTSS